MNYIPDIQEGGTTIRVEYCEFDVIKHVVEVDGLLKPSYSDKDVTGFNEWLKRCQQLALRYSSASMKSRKAGLEEFWHFLTAGPTENTSHFSELRNEIDKFASSIKGNDQLSPNDFEGDKFESVFEKSYNHLKYGGFLCLFVLQTFAVTASGKLSFVPRGRNLETPFATFEELCYRLCFGRRKSITSLSVTV